MWARGMGRPRGRNGCGVDSRGVVGSGDSTGGQRVALWQACEDC